MRILSSSEKSSHYLVGVSLLLLSWPEPVHWHGFHQPLAGVLELTKLASWIPSCLLSTTSLSTCHLHALLCDSPIIPLLPQHMPHPDLSLPRLITGTRSFQCPYSPSAQHLSGSSHLSGQEHTVHLGPFVISSLSCSARLEAGNASMLQDILD